MHATIRFLITAGCCLFFAGQLLASPRPIEFTFAVEEAGNPFARDIRAEVQLPSGQSAQFPAFYSGNGGFSVRIRAMESGDYRFLRALELKGGETQPLNALPSRTVIKPDALNAMQPLMIDPRNPEGFATADGKPFLPMGLNLPWPEGNRRAYYQTHLKNMNEAGLNWARIWMVWWAELNLDWLPADMGLSPTPGNLDLRAADAWDDLLEACEDHHIYIQMVFQQHGQWSARVDSNWDTNPWNAALPHGFLKTPDEFFTDARAKTYSKNKYRYIVARWGYSPAIMAWELFNEVDQTDAFKSGRTDIVAAWHAEMADYLRSIDPYRHLITTSLNHCDSPVYDKMDYLQPHLYAADMLGGVRQLQPPPAGARRPVFYGEYGDDNVPLDSELKKSGRPLLAALWASLAGRHSIPAQAWYAERLLHAPQLRELASFTAFVRESRYAERKELMPFTARTESPQKVPLRLHGTQWWLPYPAPTLAVPTDGRAPLEWADLPRILATSQAAKASGLPNRITLELHYPETRTAMLSLNGVSNYGASLTLRSQDTVLLTKSWAKGAAHPAETLTFSVPAGTTRLVIDNTGDTDWLDLRDLDTGLTVPALAVAGRRNESFVLLYLWHRETAASEGRVEAGTAIIPDLPAGTWRLQEWNPKAGPDGDKRLLQHTGGDLLLPFAAFQGYRAAWLERLH